MNLRNRAHQQGGNHLVHALEELGNSGALEIRKVECQRTKDAIKIWRGGKGAIQTITRAKVIQTLFSNYSDRCSDGTTATSAS
jgi:hypothetical protein